jgi:hypothetical protein
VPSAWTSAAVDDADAVAEPLGLLHVVRRVEHGHALRRQRLDRLEDRVARLGVDADGRLVEDQQLRVVQQADADVEPALHAAGELSGAVVGPVGQPDDLEHLVDAAGSSPPRMPCRRPKKGGSPGR